MYFNLNASSVLPEGGTSTKAMLKRGLFSSSQLGNEQQLCAHIANSHFQFEVSFTKVQGSSELEFVSGPS